MIIYKNVMFVIFSLVIFLLLVGVINLLNNIASLIDAKKQDIVVNSNRLATANLDDKCEATASLLKLIDIIINMEISQVIRTYSSLNTKYNINKIPDDVQAISKNVYNAIKKEVYMNDDSVITEEYLMTYITNIVTMNFISQVRGMNNILYDEV